MVLNRALLTIIFLFGYGFTQSGPAESSSLLEAEATVEIQYDGEVGSGIILMTGSPASCTTSSISSTVISSSSILVLSESTPLMAPSPSTTEIWTSSTTSTPFNTPPIFGTTRTQMVNATATDQYMLPTATGSSQMMTATNTQNLSESSTPPPTASLVTGLGIRPDVAWSHIFFWAAVTEIVLGII